MAIIIESYCRIGQHLSSRVKLLLQFFLFAVLQCFAYIVVTAATKSFVMPVSLWPHLDLNKALMPHLCVISLGEKERVSRRLGRERKSQSRRFDEFAYFMFTLYTLTLLAVNTLVAYII